MAYFGNLHPLELPLQRVGNVGPIGGREFDSLRGERSGFVSWWMWPIIIGGGIWVFQL